MGPSVYTSAHRLNKFVDKRSVFFYDIIAQPLLLSTLRESDGSRLCEQQTARFNFSFLTTLRTFKFNVYEVLLSVKTREGNFAKSQSCRWFEALTCSEIYSSNQGRDSSCYLCILVIIFLNTDSLPSR